MSLESAFQHTLARPIDIVGTGLHTGDVIRLEVRPAPPNTGYLFVRADVAPDCAEIPARWNTVTDTRLCTTVANRFGVQVATVEHLIAALRGSGVDNARIVLSGPEVPILDGSAAPLVALIVHAGLRRQGEARSFIVVRRPVRVEAGDKWAMLLPGGGAVFDLTIDFEATAIGRQRRVFELAGSGFGEILASARTFGFEAQTETLRELGLIQGGSLQNAVVISRGGDVINPEGLRYPDEFVRHKILDAIGDLALSGAPIHGRFVGHCSGHALNNALLRALLNDAMNWHIIRPGAARPRPRSAIPVG